MSTTEEHIKNILSVIPESPGCYQYFDEKGTIIYVGKAKNLKRRVSSYFNKEHDSNKTRVLVKQIRDIKYFVVDTEEDALLLENNLIKQYRPRYNVLLKDDKNLSVHRCQERIFPARIPNPEYRTGRFALLRSLPFHLYGKGHAANAERTVSATYLQISSYSRIHCERPV